MRESKVESYLKERTEHFGGLCWKWVSPGTPGVPDRLLFLPDRRLAIVEAKAKGEDLDARQKRRQAELEERGFKVFKLDSIEEIDLFFGINF